MILDPASAYMGFLGQLVAVYSNPTMDYDPGIPKRTFQQTLEGRVKAQVQSVGRRSWSLEAKYATGPQVAALLAFGSGEWGKGPFVWVPPAASRANLLSPDVASCGPTAPQHAAVTVGGPLLLPDGTWAGRSLLNSDTAIQIWFGPSTIPVLSGTQVTASAFVVGAGAQVTVQFLNAAGAAVATNNSLASGEAGIVKRLSVTAVVPALAVSCRVVARSTKQAARPALTWTDTLQEWAPGQGCAEAVVETVSAVALKSSAVTENRRDSNLSFTIREVG